MIQQLYPLLLLLVWVVDLTAQPAVAPYPAELQPIEAYQEQLELRTNHQFFLPGERILLAVNCRLPDETPSFISSMAYVELVDEAKRSVLRSSLALTEGQGSGHIYLPAQLPTGHYTLIAYTSWMRNFPLIHLPQHPIRLVNPFVPLPSQAAGEKDEYSQPRFMPEGGYYRLGQTNKVVYLLPEKMARRYGGTEVRILDPDGITQGSFIPISRGIGHFVFSPGQEGEYRLAFTSPDGELLLIPFRVQNGGQLGLSLAEGDSAFQLSVHTQGQGRQKLTVFSLAQNKLLSTHWIESGSSSLQLEKTDLPYGLVQLRLGDSLNGPFAHRLFYHRPPLVPLEIELAPTQVHTREKVRLRLGIPSELEGVMVSVSVRRKWETVSAPSPLFALLGKHLPIPLPSTTPRDLGPEELDDFLVLQPAIEETTAPQPVIPMHLPDYRGQLLQIVSNPPLQGGEHIFLTTQQPQQLHTARASANGRALMSLPLSSGGKEYILYTEKKRQLSLLSPYLNDHSFVKTMALPEDARMQDWLVKKSIEVQIENAYYTFKPDSVLKKNTSQGLLQGFPVKTIQLEEFTRFASMQEVLTELVPNLRTRRSKGRLHFTMPPLALQSIASDSALALFNGVPVRADWMMRYNPLQLEKIELVVAEVRLGSTEFRGIVNFVPYPDAAPVPVEAAYYSSGSLPAIQTPLAYYQPRYSPKESAVERMPDFRNQLLWVPALTLGLQNELFFYTGDASGTFVVIAEGVDAKGTRFYGEMLFEVLSKENQ